MDWIYKNKIFLEKTFSIIYKFKEFDRYTIEIIIRLLENNLMLFVKKTII